METINLNNYFSVDSYGDDKDKLFKINLITKTRNDSKKKYITEHHGIEQSFLIYSLAKKYKCTNFVEIGTGRGTASYAVSLLNSVKRVDTFDIIPFDKKNNKAVEFRPFYGSNKDLYGVRELFLTLFNSKTCFQQLLIIWSTNVENIFSSSKVSKRVLALHVNLYLNPIRPIERNIITKP